jgi:hypothetical protein
MSILTEALQVQQELSMRRLFKKVFARVRVGRCFKPSCRTRVRRRNHQLNCEPLEDRWLLSGYYIVNAFSGKVLDELNFDNGADLVQFQPTGGAGQRWDLMRLPNGNYEVFNAFSGKVLEDPNFSTSNGTIIQQFPLTGGLNQQWKFVPLTNGNYEVFNASSGKVLEDPNFSTTNGTPIDQFQLNGGANQQWTLLAAGDSPVVTYYVDNAASGKVLDDPNFSTSNGTGIIQFQLNGGGNQQWVFLPLANGNDLIVNASSGNVLDDPNSSTSNGTQVIQFQLNGGLNQQWEIVALANGYDEVFNASSGKVLDNPASLTTRNGNPIEQEELNEAATQQWKLLAVGDAPVATFNVANAYSGKVLDDPNFSTTNGTLIQQFQLNGGANQQWVFVPLADGLDLIVNASSGGVLDDPNFSASNGTLIQQYQLNGGFNQQWQIIPLTNGNFEVLNEFSGKVLDDPNSSTLNGTIIDQFQFNGGLNQQWKLLSPAIGWLVVAADSGGSSDVRVFNAQTGVQKFNLVPFGSSFHGGIRVAVGDVNGDGIADIITAEGPGGSGLVRVFDGITGQPLAGPLGSFQPFGPDYTGGIFVAAGDVNSDGFADVVASEDEGGEPRIKIFSGQDSSVLADFLAFTPGFHGGVRVAAADVNHNGAADVVAAAGPGGPPLVEFFEGKDLVQGVTTPALSFDAFDPGFQGGAYVATGNVHGDGIPKIIAGAGPGSEPRVSVFDGVTGEQLQTFLAFQPGFRGGVRVAAADVNGDGRPDIITAEGSGGLPRVRAFDGLSLDQLDQFLASDADFRGGVFVGGGGQWPVLHPGTQQEDQDPDSKGAATVARFSLVDSTTPVPQATASGALFAPGSTGTLAPQESNAVTETQFLSNAEFLLQEPGFFEKPGFLASPFQRVSSNAGSDPFWNDFTDHMVSEVVAENMAKILVG